MRRRDFLAATAALAAPLRAQAEGRIRIGCQTRAYGSPLPQREVFLKVLADLAGAGYEGFETNFRSLEHSFGNPAPMKAEIAERGMEMIGLHLGVALWDPARIDQERRQIERVARAVRDFGGGHLILSGRALPADANGRPRKDALAAKARELEAAGKVGRGLGVTISFHNHRHELQHGAMEVRYLLDHTDPQLVSFLFDVGHVLGGEVSPPAIVREYHSRIAGFHLRDVKDEQETLIGEGEVDFRALGGAIHETGWKGWLIVEVNKRDDISSSELVRRAYRHIRETMRV